jgi:hypothetical protein
MEQKTCTIRVVENQTGKQGVLFFMEGQLINARGNGLQEEEAAKEIFMWDEVTLSIQNNCSVKEKKIHRELQAILLDAMRMKDEKGQRKEVPVAAEDSQGVRPITLDHIKEKLEKEIGERSGVRDIFHDDSWDDLMKQVTKIGTSFDMGNLKVGYVDRGESVDFALLPGKKITVLSVNPKSPRDRIIQVLSE